MRYGGDVFDQGDLESGALEGPQSGLPARPRSVDVNLDGFHALFHRLLRNVLGRHLRREGGALSRTLELHRAGAGPANGVPAHIRDRNQGVVERRLDVRDPVRHVLLDLLLGPLFRLSHNPTSLLG